MCLHLGLLELARLSMLLSWSLKRCLRIISHCPLHSLLKQAPTKLKITLTISSLREEEEGMGLTQERNSSSLLTISTCQSQKSTERNLLSSSLGSSWIMEVGMTEKKRKRHSRRSKRFTLFVQWVLQEDEEALSLKGFRDSLTSSLTLICKEKQFSTFSKRSSKNSFIISRMKWEIT